MVIEQNKQYRFQNCLGHSIYLDGHIVVALCQPLGRVTCRVVDTSDMSRTRLVLVDSLRELEESGD